MLKGMIVLLRPPYRVLDAVNTYIFQEYGVFGCSSICGYIELFERVDSLSAEILRSHFH